MADVNGKREVDAPTSAPILQIVLIPVQDKESIPGPKYSRTAPVPPFTESSEATFKITSFGEDQSGKEPVRRMPKTFGYFTSNGKCAMTSTASAPPTPIAIIPKPPAFGVCESVPTINPPGNA